MKRKHKNHENVVHCWRDKYDIYIGRPSKWGNPFVLGKDGDRETVIVKYNEWLRVYGPINDIAELKDKRLGCYCAPKPCHGDALAFLASMVCDDPDCDLKDGDHPHW